MIEKMQSIQDQVYDLLEDANKVLPAEKALFFGGTFMTGAVRNPHFLFLGINPGFGGAWDARPRAFERQPFEVSPNKFIAQAEDNRRLAAAVVDLLLGGDRAKLDRCGESSVVSFYGTPDDNRHLRPQLSALGAAGLKSRHDRLMKKAIHLLISEMRPKHVVCTGFKSFDAYLRTVGNGSERIAMKSVTSRSGLTQPVYYKHTETSGIPTHGLLHLSGSRISGEMKDRIRDVFSKIAP